MFDVQKLKKIVADNVIDFKTLVIEMGVPKFKNKQFSKFLNHLCEKNIIAKTKNKTYFVPQIKEEIQGIIKINSKGYAFVENNKQSIFILASKLNNAFNGDEVKIKIFKDPLYKTSYQGFVTEIIKRNTTTFVGTIKSFNNKLGLIPFNKNINGIFRFEDERGLKEYNYVKVKIIEYKNPIIIVKVLKDLGANNNPLIDVILAIEDANVPYQFDFDAMLEAGKIAQKIDTDLSNRKDLRNKLIVTIDGDDTKDFDDAISVEKLANDNYLLGVHIADVSHYVKESTALDSEAKLRGTSIYLPGKVIPMLPESLSNGICSLKPNLDRLTITVEMEINKYGQVQNYQIYQSVINSKFKLTYQEVSKYYENNFLWNHQKLEEMLNVALELASILRNIRNKKGYIDFEIEEAKIILDNNGKTKQIVPKERLKAEILIEDFMVLTNEIVAKFLVKNNLPAIYRIHHKPEKEQIENLQKVINILKMNIKINHNISNHNFAKVVNQIKKNRFDNFIKIILLRTMPKAIYASYNIGHFGLALKTYTHFTSPIRRYPDLIIHRILTKYFNNEKKDLFNHFQKKLINISKNSSNAEQQAVDLERKVIDIKKAEFYEQYINQSFNGIIVSVKKFGFFVEFEDKVSGLVNVKTLSNNDGEYKLINNGYTLSNGTKKFNIGDKVGAKIISVSKLEGKIDLVVANSN